MSDYGDDVSVAESVASLFHEERELEEKSKSLYQDEAEEEKPEKEVSVKDKFDLYQQFRGVVFQDVSNDKMYVLQIKKSQEPINGIPSGRRTSGGSGKHKLPGKNK